MNLIVKPDVYQRYYKVLRNCFLWIVQGRIQKHGASSTFWPTGRWGCRRAAPDAWPMAERPLAYLGRRGMIQSEAVLTTFNEIRLRRLKVMEKEIIFLVEESPEGGYEARALGHSIFTEADTYEDLKQMVKDAVSCHFEPEHKPRVVRLHLVKEEILAV